MMGIALMAMGLMFLIFLNKNKPATAEFAAVPARVDFSAPELELRTLEGDPVSLIDHRGNVVLVNLWATWCPPCRREMPTLQAFYEEYKSRGFVLIAINQEESRDIVEEFVDEFGLTFPVWLDEDYLAQRKFGTASLPSSYVIDRNGRVRLLWIGGISKTNLEQHVPPLILE
jgi:cytochrome c biogenesis protein CcmG, thiol:disulfide interchange protein DsbE